MFIESEKIIRDNIAFVVEKYCRKNKYTGYDIHVLDEDYSYGSAGFYVEHAAGIFEGYADNIDNIDQIELKGIEVFENQGGASSQ